ncbi:MAG TPA: dihydrolipoamide acetyltransferase family protein, partial [Thermoanaerobaculia bacterium]|nr:dihydrolipoamide acetyltransferase family protein [Thermoanaerobaculia bacterium]
DQPLFEISTDKVDAEIPSPASGKLLEIRHEAGSTVEVSTVVALIGEEGESAASEAKPAATKPARAEPEAAAAAPQAAAAAPAEKAEKPAASAAAAPGSIEERVRTLSSPLVRNIAREHGVELADVPGTGIHGRVTKQDILGFIEQGGKPAAARAAAPAAAAPGKAATGFHVPAYGPNENVVIEPMSKIRQITAAHMRYSKDTSAHVTTVFEMDFTKVHRARERAKKGFQEANGTKLSYMPFIFKAVCNGLKSNPKLNAAVDGTNVVFKKDINLGMAVALDWGLLVPVIKNADRMNLIGLAQTANDLAERARAKKLKPDEAQGGTFTITNPGVFGSLFGTPIINQPQVAILGIGTIEKRPVVVTDADGCDTIAIRVMSYFGITYDHRLVDGADADHFMNDVKKTLESDSWPELEPYL